MLAGDYGGYQSQTTGKKANYCMTFTNISTYSSSHEILHLLGLKDLMDELNFCTKESIDSGGCSDQKEYMNVMSYIAKHRGLWIWQTKFIKK